MHLVPALHGLSYMMASKGAFLPQTMVLKSSGGDQMGKRLLQQTPR